MLMSSIFDEMLPQIINCKTAQELWKTLDQTFTSESQARILTICLQLTNAKKGNLSISDYYHQIKNTTATLAVAEQQISDAEFTSYLLGGLGPEYDPFVTSITTRVEPLSYTVWASPRPRILDCKTSSRRLLLSDSQRHSSKPKF
jgi:hypothetical protein